MKFAVRSMTFLLALLWGVAACAQSSSQAPVSPFPPNINHVVIIFQENRTPDNLFQGLAYHGSPYDIQTFYTDPKGAQHPLSPVALANNFDLDHSHGNFEFEFKNPGVPVKPVCHAHQPGCPQPKNADQFMFVKDPAVVNYDGSHGHLLDPYLTFAKSYGWANKMFQTNQGPSYPAHQFIFAGTSARSNSDDAAAVFVSENPTSFDRTGCLAPSDETYCLIFPSAKGPGGTKCSPKSTANEIRCKVNGETSPDCLGPKNGSNLCFSRGPDPNQRRDLAYLLDKHQRSGKPDPIDWKYYAPSDGTIWTAPNSVKDICEPKAGACTGTEWKKHVVLSDPEHLNPAPVLRDIAECKLAPVSWVIPDAIYSDHANVTQDLGPSWVAAIVNSIGTSKCPSGNWNDTAIVITWDDWGGWFDHVSPPAGIPTGDQRDYQYGFRVPLIVVSAYTPEGYVNNEVHDFGSILRMVEGIFGLGQGDLGFADARSRTDLREFFTHAKRPDYKAIPALKDADFFHHLKIKPRGPDRDGLDDD